jgi:hypothetical protein
MMTYHQQMDKDSVVGTAVRYSLEDLEYEHCWGKRISPLHTHPEQPWGSASIYNG